MHAVLIRCVLEIMAAKPDEDVTDVQRRDGESQWMLRLELPGGGRAKRKMMDVLEEDMRLVGVKRIKSSRGRLKTTAKGNK